MFIVANNNKVEFGPINWNKYRIEYFLKEEYNIDFNLPFNNFSIIVINETCKIYPVIFSTNTFNRFTEFLNGPFWEFTDTHAIGTYLIENNSIEKIKNILKQTITQIRWSKESTIIDVVVNNTIIKVLTHKEKRIELFQKYSILEDNSVVQWKHSNGWTELSKLNFKQLVDAVNNYIEEQFIWEKTKYQEINNCQTIDELKTFITNENLN